VRKRRWRCGKWIGSTRSQHTAELPALELSEASLLIVARDQLLSKDQQLGLQVGSALDQTMEQQALDLFALLDGLTLVELLVCILYSRRHSSHCESSVVD